MKSLFAALAALALAGCTSFSKVKDQERYEQVTGIDRHSSYPALRRDSFEFINFLELVDPEQKAAEKFKAAWGSVIDEETGKLKRTSDGNSNISYGVRYDLVLSWFRQTDQIGDAEKQRRRNGIQERMLSVSISRCNVFKTYLRRDQADTNFTFGALTTVSAVLGAVLPGVTASRNLSGAAGLFSGIRSEFNQAYYSNLAAHVIVKGIEAKQEEIYKRIQTEGQAKSIDAYPLDAAIKDAIYFDGQCSLVAGLDKAAVSVDAAAEPGIDAAMRTVLRARLLKDAADLSSADILKPETLDKFGSAGKRLGLSLVGSARAEVGVGGGASDVDLYIAVDNLMGRIKDAARDTAAKLDQATLAQKAKLLGEMTAPDEATLAKSLAGMSPKAGETAASVAAAIDKGVIKKLGLEASACYVAHALPAVKARGEAVSAKQAAENEKDPTKMKQAQAEADYALKKAARAIQQAHDEISRIETLVLIEFGAYQTARIGIIEKAAKTAVMADKDWRSLSSAAEIAPAASKDVGCAKSG